MRFSNVFQVKRDAKISSSGLHSDEDTRKLELQGQSREPAQGVQGAATGLIQSSVDTPEC